MIAALTTLAPWLLGFAGAAAIPVLVHLISRSRHREVKWGAMHLIELTLQQKQNRMRVENWLLMLLRCLLPLLLAFMMAQPILKGASILWDEAKVSVVLVLDNSYSMDHAGTGGTNFELEREAAAALVKELPRGSDVNVVLMSHPDKPLYDKGVFNLDAAANDLQQMKAGFGQAQVPAALQKGLELVAAMEHPHKEVVVFSDFQRLSWGAEEGPLRQRAVAPAAAMDFPPNLTLFHVGAEGRENVCVESLEFSHLLLGVNQKVQVRANLRNHGTEDHPALQVAFLGDGKELKTTQIPLAPGETRQVLFTHSFAKAGSHVVEVSIDADTLKADNVYRASVPVWDNVPVLIVDGDPSDQPLRSETDYLNIALQPYREGATKDLVDLLQTRVVTVPEFNARAIGEARVVVLANVNRLQLAQLNDLQAFVRDGGGLLIFGGEKLDLNFYNDRMHPFQLLPTRLAAVEDRSGEPEPFSRMVVRRFEHPALRIFNDQRNGDLGAAEIRKWHRTVEEPDNTLVNTIARLGSGDAFLVEKGFGAGRVMFCASTVDDAWNNLPGRTFFVPFAQRLCTYLASSVLPPRNLGVGEEVVAHFPAETAGGEVKVIDSLGKEHAVKVELSGGRGVARFNDTQRPGLYTLAGPDGSLHFVVNTGRAESNLEQVTDMEREETASELNANLVASLADYQQLDDDRRHGQVLWKKILCLVIIVLLIEQIVACFFNRLGRRGPGKAKATAEPALAK